MKMVLNRDLVLRTRKGYGFTFKKGEPIFVPERCHDDVLAIGGEFVEEKDKQAAVAKLAEKDEKKKTAVPEGKAREKVLRDAIELMLARDEREDFGGNGAPVLARLSSIVGFNVNAKERNDLWNKIRAEMNNEPDNTAA